MMSALKLPVTLLHDQADACLAQWVAQLAQWPAPWPSAVALDASALADFDSSALAVLLGLRRVVTQNGGGRHDTAFARTRQFVRRAGAARARLRAWFPGLWG